jgi:NDP-sugar pyrophosphorylase family protein
MKAMVLCAGYGTRLGQLASELPKPMLPLGDRPMLEHILCHLARHGFDEIAINLHFRPEAITSHFGDGSRWGIRLSYSHESELLGTAGGLKKIAGFLAGSGPFLVQYGDVVTDEDFTAMLRFHQQRQALATVLVHRRERSNSMIALDDNSGTCFLRTPGNGPVAAPG